MGNRTALSLLVLAALLVAASSGPAFAQTTANLVFRATTEDDVKLLMLIEHPDETYLYPGASLPEGASFRELENGTALHWDGADGGIYAILIGFQSAAPDPAIVQFEIERDGAAIESAVFNLWPGDGNERLFMFEFWVGKQYRTIGPSVAASTSGQQEQQEGERPSLTDISGSNTGQDDNPQQPVQPTPTLAPTSTPAPSGPVQVTIANQTGQDLCYIQIQSMNKTSAMDDLGEYYLNGQLMSTGQSIQVELEAGRYFMTATACDPFSLPYQVWDFEASAGATITITEADNDI